MVHTVKCLHSGGHACSAATNWVNRGPADAPDPLEAAGAELEVGTAGLASQRGISRERARQAALAARVRLQLVA